MLPGAARIHPMSVPVSWSAVQQRLAGLLAPASNCYRPLRIGGQVAGWIAPERVERLRAFANVFRVAPDAVEFVPALDNAPARTTAMAFVAGQLRAEELLTAWRDELYCVARELGDPPWFLLERAAARYFGVHTHAVHGNCLVKAHGKLHLWFARRSTGKAIDPGMLDNLVGGGLAADTSVAETLAKEAWEEAGISAATARTAAACGKLHVRRDQPDGLHWETIFVYDIGLPMAFKPVNQDGEAVGHRLVTLDNAARLIASDCGVDQVTADASLVVLDCLLRHGAVPADAQEWPVLHALGRTPV